MFRPAECGVRHAIDLWRFRASANIDAPRAACTATVTEIAYHNKKTIEADIAFLSEQEWMEELNVLLDDLIDEDGTIKRSSNLTSDAGVAWSKVHAVYPSLTHDQIGNMTAQWGRKTAEKIVERDPRKTSAASSVIWRC